GAHFYNVYETADGRHLAVGAIEPQFYVLLVQGLGFAVDELPAQNDKSQWPAMKQKFAARIKEKTLAEWTAIFDGTDACVSPVHGFDDALADAHNRARQSFVRVDGIAQPAPAPRFSRTVATIARGADAPGASTNGKATTTAFLATAMRTRGPVATNDKGANMPTGILAAMGHAPPGSTAVLEVDEGYVPALLSAAAIDVLVLLNLSRDQLDRVAE